MSRICSVLIFVFSVSNSFERETATTSTGQGNLTDGVGNKYNFEDGVVSKQTMETTLFVVNIILKPIVTISGFVMNVIGIRVLLNKYLRHASYSYLLALLISDCGYLLCDILSIPIDIYKLTNLFYASYVESRIAPVTSHYLTYIFSRVSSFVICFLACERFLAIRFPLQIKYMPLSRHSGKISIAVFIFVFIVSIPRLFERYYELTFNQSENITMYMIEKIWYEPSVERFYRWYTLIVKNTLMLYVPVCVLLLCNVAIFVQLCIIQKHRMNMFGQVTAEQSKVTVTLLAISLVFLMVYVPLMVVHVLHFRQPNIFSLARREHYFMVTMTTVTSFGWSFNCANDFIVYLGTNSKFRTTCFLVFCRRDATKRECPNTNT